MKDIAVLAHSFIHSDQLAARQDVDRLGGIPQAAAYCAEIADGQPHWQRLASDEGRAALEDEIRKLLAL